VIFVGMLFAWLILPEYHRLGAKYNLGGKMGELRWKAYSARWAGLALLAAILLAPRFAAAQVQYFVNVQPIQVCPQGGDCAPIGEPGDNQIGFVDSNGNNITRAIPNQAGIDVNFLPVQTITSPADLNQAPNSLQLFPGAVPGQVSSPDFKALSDQEAISKGQPPTPAPPLSPDPHTVNLFFVPFLNPNGNLQGSTYFGVGWIGNNGAVVDQAIFGSQSFFFGTIGAVPDAIAHETVHVLGLDHPTDNTPQQINNLMSAVRNEPDINGALAALASGSADQLNTTQIGNIINPGGGPLNSFLNPIPGVVTSITPADPVLVAQCIEFAACWTPGHPPTPWSHTLSSADLASLGLGTTEPLVAAQTSRSIIRLGATTITFDTTSGLVTESLPQFSGSAAHNDPCNFCEIDTVGTFSIPANAIDATISGAFGNTIVPNSAGVDVCLGAGPPCGPVLTNDFSVLFQDPGRPGESLTSLTLMATAGFELVPSLFSQLELSGDTPGITASLLNPNCTISCTLVFLGNPFVLGDRLDYTIGVCAVEGEACVLDSDITALAGGRYSYLFSDGYMTTSVLELVNGALMASSRMPDLTTATTLDLSRFTPFSTSLPCAMRARDAGCPPLVLPDDDTIENLIFFQAPEPPPVTIILVGLGLLLGLALQRRQAREARVIPRRYRLTPLFHSIPALRSPPIK
jgi:hypothetical protein